MNEIQRLIRKLQPSGPRSFDEQTWPINVALVVLGSYAIGVVLSVLHFNDPRWHSNAITWIFGVSAVIALTIFAVTRLEEKTALRRTLIFSMVLSLIINLSLMVMMAWTSIFAPLWQQDKSQAITRREKQEVVIPEYSIVSPDPAEQKLRQEFEKPVETGEPEAQEQVQLRRQEIPADVQPTERPSAPEEIVQKQDVSKPKRANTPSAPRRSQTLAKLSRQNSQAEPKLSRQLDRPTSPAQPSKPAPESTVSPSSEVAKMQRTSNTPMPNMPEVELTSPRRNPDTSLARASSTPTESMSLSSLPTLKRRMDRPRNVPRSAMSTADRPTTAEKTADVLAASSTVPTKQKTTTSDTKRQIDFEPRVAHNLARANTRVDRPETETLSQAVDRATLNRNRAASTTATESSQTQSTDDAPSEAIAASSSAAKRQNSQAPARRDAVTPTESQSPSLQPSSQAVAKVTSAESPSLAKSDAAARSLSRANVVSRTATSTNVSADSVVQSTADSESPNPTTEPSRMALSRSSVGIAGVGDAMNLERGVAAPESPVNLASASANRTRATQTMEPGPALAPSQRAPDRQLRANENVPRSSMLATDVQSAMVPGASQPSAEASSSAASIERNQSNAAAGATTAAVGSTEIDLGPTRIATDTSEGRAEGGGQPEISQGEQPRALSRANLTAGKSSIRAETNAADVASPAGRTSATVAGEAASTSASVAKTSTQNLPQGGGSQNSADSAADDGEIRIARAGGARDSNQSQDESPSFASGGTNSPGRRARSLSVRSRTQAAVPSLASAADSGGSRTGQPLDAQGSRAERSAAGMLVRQADAIGAAQGDLEIDGQADSRIAAPNFQRRTDFQGDEGEALAFAQKSRGTARRSQRMTLSGGSTGVEIDPEEFAVNAPLGSDSDELNGTDGMLAAANTASSGGGALLVEIEAPEAEGGLGTAPAPDAGIFSRQAQSESEFVGLRPARFLSRTSPTMSFSASTHVALPSKAFRRRLNRRGEELAGERGLPSPKTEAAIELGLVFLSRYQSADGSWSFNNFADGKTQLPAEEDALIVSDAAATGLALLSFMGAGYSHHDEKYQETIKGGIDFLVKHQKEDGDLYIDQDSNSSRSAWLYSHGICAIAMCEAYGMTQDPDLEVPAQKAINFIMEAQHPTRGGWRYSPAYGADTSVSGWMMMALKSGELAGLRVEQSTYKSVQHWLDLAQQSDTQPHLYRYNPYAPNTAEQRHGRKPTRAMTAVGLLARLYLGWRRDDPNMVLGAQTLQQNLPEMGTSSKPRRDTYYWYYATQVMYHMGGEYWESWNRKLHPLLTQTQVKTGDLAGSWNPQTPLPDRWGAHGGRLYVTTLNLLSLEVFYRHLPIYEETSK